MIQELNTTEYRLAMPVLEDAGLESRINAHFGKSKAFVVVDCDGNNYRYFEADALRQASECAPISGLVGNGAKAVMCRGMGKGAMARCSQAGLVLLDAPGSTVGECIANFLQGLAEDFPDSSICSHGESCCGHDHHE